MKDRNGVEIEKKSVVILHNKRGGICIGLETISLKQGDIGLVVGFEESIIPTIEKEIVVATDKRCGLEIGRGSYFLPCDLEVIGEL